MCVSEIDLALCEANEICGQLISSTHLTSAIGLRHSAQPNLKEHPAIGDHFGRHADEPDVLNLPPAFLSHRQGDLRAWNVCAL